MEDGEEDSRRHFNFKQIVKDETSSGKKKKWKKKRKPAAEAPQQDDFQVGLHRHLSPPGWPSLGRPKH